MKQAPAIILTIATLTVTLMLIPPANGTDFTLSEAGILSLDDNMSNIVAETGVYIFNATILSNQDIPGTGVIFTIHFPSTNFTDATFYWTSNSSHGVGALTNLNVGAYTSFVLKFTVLSIDGSTSGGQILQIGSLIGPYNASPYSYAYNPEFASLTGFYPPSVVSTVTVGSATVTDIGFTINQWPHADLGPPWSAGPHDVTLLVQPADGAVQLPEVPSCALSSVPATNDINYLQTVVAGVAVNGQPPIPVVFVNFFVSAGPNVGKGDTVVAQPDGSAAFAYNNTGGIGTDTILATGLANSLSFTGTTTVVWINANSSPPALTYTLKEIVHKCRLKLNPITTNLTEKCNISFSLTVTNTGITNTPAFPVRLWNGQGQVFDSSAGMRPRLIRVKALKQSQVKTINFRGDGFCIYATDTNDNVLARLLFESP